MKYILCKKNGVTVTEVIVAAFILAISFIPVLRAVSIGSVSTAKTGYYAKAARLAQQLVEECKHVPFKSYQENYNNLESGESFPVVDSYFATTKQSIDEFFKGEQTKDFVKEYDVVANLKAKKNDLNQISELWFEVEIYWREKGDLSNEDFHRQSVRYGNAYYNSEAN